LERIYDWQPEATGSGVGRETGSRWFVVVTGEKMRAAVHVVSGLMSDSRVRWLDQSTLEVSALKPLRFALRAGSLAQI
jgi:hypothetical protein